MSEERTVFEALVAALAAATEYNSNDQVAPAAVLWTDGGNEWAELAPRLRETLPQFLTLGEYDPATKTGPGIWLRCMIARTLPEADWPEDATPIIYIPGFSRHDLRAVEDCPREIAPIAELQYRGALFSQVSGRDWTLLAFLVSKDGGLGLSVAGNEETKEAMRRALSVLADTPVGNLRGQMLQAADFNELVDPDETRSLLDWMSNEEDTRRRLDENHWGAFVAHCGEKYGFNPATDGTLIAAEKLGERSGNWETAWRRFAEAPERYPGIPALLRQARPDESDTLFFDASSWPQDNERLEGRLRDGLAAIADHAPAEARAAIRELEREHGQRREWVWATLGQAPLAKALEHLTRVAEITKSALGGATPEDIAQHYADGQWEADAAALDALAAVDSAGDMAAVASALGATYRPWLEEAAHHFQATVQQHGYPYTPSPADVEDGACILFADGLRFDVGQRLQAALDGESIETQGGWFFAAVPTVTATAKPAVAPTADQFTGGGTGEDFLPCTINDGKSITTDRLRKSLEERGYEIIADDETGDPTARGWTEFGALDSRGHSEGAKLARRIDEEINGLLGRIRSLLEAGWRQVVVVTDHGWLLLPGGLPKVELPHYLTETRWGRCAALKPTSQSELPTVPWRWNKNVRIVPAPGIACFRAGSEFAHGGLSAQECVVPTLRVLSAESGPAVTIEEVKWVGLRCRVTVAGGEGLTVDLRTKVSDASSSVAEAVKTIDSDGSVSLVVPDDTLEGTGVNLVVLDEAGRAAARRATAVGGD